MNVSHKEKQDTFDDFINELYHNRITIENFFDFDNYDKLWSFIIDDLKKHSKYLRDGRKDDALEATLIRIDINKIKDIDYSKFLSLLIEEIKKYDERNILILPLNGVDKSLLPEVMEFSNPNIKIFSINENSLKIQRDKSLIANYVKESLGITLNMSHMRFKDRNFFKTPVLTIIVDNRNDNEVYDESQEIVQGIYSLIRMHDLINGNEHKGWKFYNSKTYPVTYAVYNKCGEKTSYITGGCGHQMKVFSAPILDVDTNTFIKHSEMLVKEIEFLMTAVFEPNATNDFPLFYAKKRWINALQIFNTAYEQASINRYDATLISLVSILESLFLKKNTYNKKKRLIFYISEFLDKNCREIINKSYKKRSAFVHEGIRFGEIHPYKLAEIPHNYIPGFRPFTDYSFLAYPQKVNEIKQLMQLCSRIILKMIKDNNFMIGQYKIKPSSKTDISYNSIKKEVLSHLIILDDDIDTFNYYLDIRGIGTYYDAIKNLMIYTENEKIEFNDFMGFIRYDKNLKDVLYKMLGSFEENLKENIYNHFDYIGEKPFSKITDQNIHLFVKLKPTGGFGWNLYRNSRLELGSMIHLINSNDHVIETKSDNYLEDLNNIKDLRNLVMHHKMLLVDQSKEPKSKAQIENRISNVLDGIISLYKLLPSDYDKGLISAINKANYDSKRNTVKSKYIYIRHLEGGY